MSAVMTPATIRGRAALDEVRALFDQLYLIDSDLEHLERNDWKPSEIVYQLTHDEVLGVLQDRRNAVLTKLENKGIRIAPDPMPVAEAA